ncbi:hypothetical protein EMCRGX_G002472 [Ephydatia muelleri]
MEAKWALSQLASRLAMRLNSPKWPSNGGLDLTPQRAPNVHCAQVVHLITCHHAVTCKYGGDVVSRHNRIRDILVETCRRAHIGVKVEVGNNLSRDHSKTRPADILLPNWFLGRTAALDVSITSPLNPVTLLEAGVSATAAAQATEARKHQANDPKCSELGWVCVPMVVETYGAWGKEATAIISSVASRLATSTCRPKSTILHEIYGLNLHLEPNEFQIAVKWWLGMDVSFGSCCPHCPDHRLDPLGHHALTCKHGGIACLGGQVEVGSGQGHDRLNSRPADVLVKNWHLGKPAAFDLTITSPLNPTTLTEAGVKCGSSAQVAEVRKHAANDGKCKELGWVCIPLAVESYGCWGMEAQESFKRLAARLAIQMGCSRSQATPHCTRG